MQEISARSWMRYVTQNFAVETEVMGASHNFILDGYKIKIKLPQKDQASRGHENDQIASVVSWRSETNEPLEIQIHQVDIEVKLKEKVSVPKVAASSKNIDIRVFEANEKENLNKITKKHSEISDMAFRYWLELLRWSTGSPFIGTQPPHSNKSGWGTYIIDEETENRFYCGRQSITITIRNPVTAEQWKLTQERLSENLELPMHIKFTHDAQISMKIGHYDRAIVELALACEMYLRYSVLDYLPPSLQKEFIDYIEEANISRYLNQFFKKIVDGTDIPKFNKVKKEISSLMSKRNDYMHMGVIKDSSLKNCRRYLLAVGELFAIKKSEVVNCSN